jgi:hypothetical protein
MEENKSTYEIFVQEPGGRRPLGIPRSTCEDNIKTDPKKIRWM